MLDFGALDASLHSSIKTQTQPRNYWGSKTSREHHRCHDHTCSSNDHCPFYGIGNAVSEDYGYYFYVLVESILCENYRNIFLRKRYSVHAYENLLAENDIAEDDQLRALLDRLGQRGIYIGNGVSEWSGVHGWLNSEECTQLAEELWCIDLPYFESTPEHLQSKRPNQKMLMDVSGETEREKMWHQMTLAYLRAFAEIAGNTGKGIVWMST